MARKWTEEEKKAFGAKMKAAREAKKQVETPENSANSSGAVVNNTSIDESNSGGENTPPVDEIGKDPSVDDLKRQIDELKAYLFNQSTQQAQPQGPQVNQQGILKGTFEKYLVDPALYPSPTERLAAEPRLAAFAFGHNYNLDYEVAISSYETKDGINTKEPRFHLTLSRKRYDDQGEPLRDKDGNQLAYIVRKMTYHEDPQSAVIVARERNLDIDQSNERVFLNEMRYLRTRDWLFDIFFPKQADTRKEHSQEVVDGKLVQVISIASTDAQTIPFAELK